MCRSINCVYFLVVLGLCLFFMLYQFVVVWDLLSAYHRWEKKEKKKKKKERIKKKNIYIYIYISKWNKERNRESFVGKCVYV